MNPDIDKHIEMEKLKNKFIDTGLLFGSILGIAAFIPGFLSIIKSGFKSSHIIDSFVLISFFLIYIFRKQIRIKIKSVFIIIGLFLFTFSDLYYFGILSVNKSLVIVALFMFFLIFKLRKTILIFAIYSLIFSVIAYFHLDGKIGNEIDHNIRSVNINIWIVTYILTAIISFAVIILLREYYKRFTKLINDLDRKNRDFLKNESKYTQIFNATTDAIIIYDMPGNILEVNKSMLEMFKCHEEDLTYLTPGDFSLGESPYDDYNAKLMIKKAIKKGEHSFEWMSKNREGHIFWTNITLKKTKIIGEDRVFAVVKDIDKQKRLSLELEAHKNNLEEAVNERTEELLSLNEELNESNERLIELNNNIEYQKHLIEEKEKRLNTIIYNQGEGLAIVDLEENVKLATNAMHEIFGVQNGKLIGRNLKDFIIGENWEEVLSHTAKRKESKRSSYEVKIMSEDGFLKNIILTGAPDFDENGNVIGTIANFRDITDRITKQKKLKELNEELTASNEELNEAYVRLKKLNQDIGYQKAIIEKNEKRLNSIIENQGEGLGITNLEEEFIYASPSAHRILEVPQGYLKGKNLRDFFEEKEWEKILTQTKERQEKRSSSYELTINLKSGKKKHLIVTGSPDFNERGEVIGTIANFRDITDRIQREQKMIELNEELEVINEELHEANEELSFQKNELQKTIDKLKHTQQQLIQSEKMASLGVLAAGVAHEINNPLNFIMGGVTALESLYSNENEPNAEQIGTIIEAIGEGVKRANEIVTSLGHFSRQGSSIDEDCHIHKIIDNCLMMLRNRLKYKVDLIKEYHTSKIIIKANEGKLHQVFLNILTNAEQSIAEKGKIRIKTDVNNTGITIVFEDNGSGINEQILSKITDPFFTTKEPGKGTGLGLSIVQQIINEHSGSVRFESEEGKGTKVTIKLPVN